MSETTPDFDFLRSIPIFKGLTDKALKILLTNSTKALFHKGSDIFTIGDTVKNLYLVEIGEIEIYKYSLEGKSFIYGIAEEVIFFVCLRFTLSKFLLMLQLLKILCSL